MLVENISVGEKKKNEKKDNIEAVKNSRMFYYFHIYGQARFYCLLFLYEIYA